MMDKINKKEVKKKRYWLRGGIMGIIIALFLALIIASKDTKFFSIFLASFGILIFPFFVIGVIDGFIIGKIISLKISYFWKGGFIAGAIDISIISMCLPFLFLTGPYILLFLSPIQLVFLTGWLINPILPTLANSFSSLVLTFILIAVNGLIIWFLIGGIAGKIVENIKKRKTLGDVKRPLQREPLKKRYWLRFGIFFSISAMIIILVEYLLFSLQRGKFLGFGFLGEIVRIPVILIGLLFNFIIPYIGIIIQSPYSFIPVLLLLTGIIWFIVGMFIGWIYGKIKDWWVI